MAPLLLASRTGSLAVAVMRRALTATARTAMLLVFTSVYGLEMHLAGFAFAQHATCFIIRTGVQVTAQAPKHAYKALDGMRGIAALAVVFLHAKDMLGPTLFPRGYLAVDFFFVLSGFVIAYAYDGRLSSRNMLPSAFVVTRVIRFYPLYLAGLLIGLARECIFLAAHHSYAMPLSTLISATISGLLFVPWPIPARNNGLFPLNFPSWSLFYELAVNIAYAAVQRYLSSRSLFAILLVTGVALSVFTIDNGSVDLGSTIEGLAVGAVRTVFSFTFGLLIFRLGWRTRAIPISILFLILAAAFAVPRLIGISNAIYDIAFVVCVSPSLVAAGSACMPSRRWMPAVEYLGVISFPIYAIHLPVLTLVGEIGKKLHIPVPLSASLAIVAMLVVCPGLVRWYDAPLRRGMRKISRDKLLDGSASQ